MHVAVREEDLTTTAVRTDHSLSVTESILAEIWRKRRFSLPDKVTVKEDIEGIVRCGTSAVSLVLESPPGGGPRIYGRAIWAMA